MGKRAVIDLGTNTFHLLIANRHPAGHWQTLLRERIFVKLAEDGIEHIGDQAFARGLEALQRFRQQLDAHQVMPDTVRAYGTAALRTARNAPEFLLAVREQTGILAEAIDGHREALLIYQGVRQAVPFPDNPVLVMDIGGGSVEMVLARGEQVLWQHSFPVGVALLFRRFHKSDPIAEEEIKALEQFLDVTLAQLWDILAQHPTPTLIGAAGAFDIIDHLLLDPDTKPPLYGYIPVERFDPLYEQVIGSTLAERESWEDLMPERREMIVVGLILIRHILRRGVMREVYTSVYAMKEGMLAEGLL
ncbi:MAG: hypothetical protein EP344_02235 [Bacteroidetes bacterium]|nr:MAG: hypothetical protein EP344_02235 [Bacteroidota bacterium]